jgi:hypothetical protein
MHPGTYIRKCFLPKEFIGHVTFVITPQRYLIAAARSAS